MDFTLEKSNAQQNASFRKATAIKDPLEGQI